MIRYPQKAFKAFVHLFKPYNDVDIFIEDSLNRNMYEILINRILAEKASIKRIFSLGARDEVIKECRADQGDRPRRRLYLIDGDMDLLLDNDGPSLRFLYRLNVYTSENLIISQKAAVEVAFESSPAEAKENIEKAIDIGTLLEEAENKLLPLFAMYAVKDYFEMRDSKQIHIKTAGHKIHNLCDDGETGISISGDKVEKRIDEVRNHLMREHGYKRKDINEIFAGIESRLRADAKKLRFISGKTYLLPLIYHRLQKVAHCACNMEQLKTRMARFAELDLDSKLGPSLLLISQGSDLLA